MLTRREFAGIATCAVCGLTDLAATGAAAQTSSSSTTPGTTTPGVTRKILSQTDGPAPGYVTIIADVTLEPGVTVARHTHPGVESSFVLEGSFELPVQGQPTRLMKAGDAFQIPPETPHAGGKPTDTKARILVNYIVEKGKPLASPA